MIWYPELKTPHIQTTLIQGDCFNSTQLVTSYRSKYTQWVGFVSPSCGDAMTETWPNKPPNCGSEDSFVAWIMAGPESPERQVLRTLAQRFRTKLSPMVVLRQTTSLRRMNHMTTLLRGDDEWFQRDLTKQPSPVKTMHLRPGVAVKDLYTGESRSSDMQKYEGQMSRQEYMAFMGFEIPEIHEEASTVIAQEARTQGEFNRVDEIRSQFQELSLLYPPVRLALPSRRPQSAPTRPRISIPQRKELQTNPLAVWQLATTKECKDIGFQIISFQTVFNMALSWIDLIWFNSCPRLCVDRNIGNYVVSCSLHLWN